MHGGYIDHDRPCADADLPKWKRAVDAVRKGFWEIQLRAAIRKNRELAVEVLAEPVPPDMAT